MTPLQQAIIIDRPELVALLLKRSSQPLAPFGEGALSPLHLAVMAGSLSCLRLVLAHHPGLLAARDKLGRTPLHVAVMEDSAAMAQALVNGGAALLDADHLGRTPMHWATLLGRTSCADVVGSPAVVGAVDNVGATALHLAAGARQAGMVNWLLQAGADANSAKDAAGRVPLHCAAAGGSAECVAALLYAVVPGSDGAAPGTEVDDSGMSVLHHACLAANAEALAALLEEAGLVVALVNLGDAAGETALAKAAKVGSLACVQLILKHGTCALLHVYGPPA